MDDPMEILRQYGPPVAIGLTLAVIIFLAFTFHRHRQEAARAQASELFMQAQSPEQLQAIIDDFPGTVTAPIALLSLASERFHGGDYGLAATHYRQFLERYPDHIMRPTAELGLVYCDEAQGLHNEALNGFETFLATHGEDHFLASPARLGKARVLGLLGRFDEARAIYDAILDDPDHPWRAQARSDKLYLEKEMRAQGRL